MNVKTSEGVAPDEPPMSPRGPKYLRIADALRAQIQAGQLKAGDRLPAESVLKDDYRVSLLTLRQAVGVLRAEGLLQSRQGIGTFVVESRRRQRRSRNRYGRARGDQKLLTADLRHDIVSAGIEPAPANVAEAMDIEPGTELVVRRRHLSDKDTGRLEEIGASYIPTDIAKGTYLEDLDVVPKALFLCVEELSGKQYAYAHDSWVSRLATSDEADLFDVADNMHVLHVVHTARADDGTVLEVSESIWPADRVRFVDEYDIARGTARTGPHSDI